MSALTPPSLHATCLVMGEKGVLIRGASGSGKSALAEALILHATQQGQFARLVADDRVLADAKAGRLLARPHPAIAGLIERRGLGIGPMASLSEAVITAVIDLVKGPTERLPLASEREILLAGILLPRCPLDAELPIDRKIQLSIAFLEAL